MDKTVNDNGNDRQDTNNKNAEKDNDEIVLPKLKYGYRKTPMSWSEMQTFICVEQDLAKLARSEEQQRQYMIAMRDINSEYKTMYDFILHDKFGFDRKQDNEKKWQACLPSQPQTTPRTVLVPNDFPYSMAPGIHHYILWKWGGDVTPEEIDQAKLDFKNDNYSDHTKVIDVLHWINPPHLKSLPDIDHVHILTLREPAQLQEEETARTTSSLDGI